MSSVTIDDKGVATIAWSDTLNGAVRAKDSTVTLPSALAVPSTSVIWAEAQYDYKPTIGYVITGHLRSKINSSWPRGSRPRYPARRSDRL